MFIEATLSAITSSNQYSLSYYVFDGCMHVGIVVKLHFNNGLLALLPPVNREYLHSSNTIIRYGSTQYHNTMVGIEIGHQGYQLLSFDDLS